jgi:hypothetical protein
MTDRAAQRHPDGDGVFRVVRDAWRNTGASGRALHVADLPDEITRIAGDRNTSRQIRDVADILRLVSG